jgi:hypothetical protein
VDEVEELADVAQQLVRDAEARRVDRDLDAGGGVEHRGREHADRDRLAEAARRRDEHLLWEALPAVELEDSLVVARELPRRLRLPEDAAARADELLVELLLVERALPAAAVERLERAPAARHARPPVRARRGRARRAAAPPERRLQHARGARAGRLLARPRGVRAVRRVPERQCGHALSVDSLPGVSYTVLLGFTGYSGGAQAAHLRRAPVL